LSACSGSDRAFVIDLSRPPGARPLVVGHRGAPRCAPENTLRGFRAAVSEGVDLVELDVTYLHRGPLVVAHSHRITEIVGGAAGGSLRNLTLDEARELAPELPTLDEALAFFGDEAAGVGVHLDLKLGHRLDEVARAIEHHGLAGRTVVSSCDAASLRAIARYLPTVCIGLTYPRDRLQLSLHRALAPVVAAGLRALRAAAPRRIVRLAGIAGASAVMLQHRLVTPAAVAEAHARGLPVLAWTVDEAEDVRRVLAAGVDGVITNDPSSVTAMTTATLTS
jgi:glycerophosphoryl diester phosphodiesterase